MYGQGSDDASNISRQGSTKFDTLRFKKKKFLGTGRQDGGEDTFLGTAAKAAERHSVAMPMQSDMKTRSLNSTWLTSKPDSKKTKLLQPSLMRLVKAFPGKISPQKLQSYIAKMLGDADSTAASSAEITWTLKCTVKQIKVLINGRSHAYCLGAVLSEGSAEVESMQKEKTDLNNHKEIAECRTDILDLSVHVKDTEIMSMPVADPHDKVLILEVWSVKKEKEGMRRMSSVTSLNEHGEKFAGRVFCPLQGIPLEGETRELSLYSHSKRHKRGDLSIHLCYKPCQTVDVFSAMLNYGHLFKVLVFHESMTEQSEMKHAERWTAKLSPEARQLLLTQAISSGISDMQCIAMELGVLMDYHEWYLVDWNAFLSLVERIESNLSSTSSPGQPLQGPQKGSNWVPELNHQLLELVKCIQDRLCMHLYVLRVNRDDQKGRGEAGLKEQQQTGHPIADLKGELITLLQTLQKLYSFPPFVEQSGRTMEDCVKGSIEDWFLKLSASVQPPKGNTSKASVLTALAEACLDTCSSVQKYIVAVFKEFGVDYFSIFIQAVGSKLSDLCRFCISEEKSLPLDKDAAVVYYAAYRICREIEKCAISVDPSLSQKLNIWSCYGHVVGSWIEAACTICKERIRKAVELDEVVKVTDGARYSSSAVDVETFLHQSVAFWKSLSWPDAEQAFGYALAHFQNICHCTEDYAKTIFKSVNTKDLSGQSFEIGKVEKMCIVFNNMAHLCNQLYAVSEQLDMDSLYARLSRGQDDAKKSFDRLRESTREDIWHRIMTIVEQYSKRLTPDIQSFITNIMATGEEETNTPLEALHDFLTQSLQAFGDYLLDEVFQIILARVWSTTLKCFQEALKDIQKGIKGQVESTCLQQAVLALRTFFYADGNGLTGENLENLRYTLVLTDLKYKCLPSSELAHQCCVQLYKGQPQSSTIGELTINAAYVEEKEKSVLEVNVLSAKLSSGTKKDGSADTFVQAWVLPQMVLQDTKSNYKTDIKKGTLTPRYDKELRIPAKAADIKKEGSLLALAVYCTDTKHIAGLTFVPCQDIPFLQAQGSSTRREWTLPLFLIQDTTSAPLKELLVRQAAHDTEATSFYKYLNKKLHVTFCS